MTDTKRQKIVDAVIARMQLIRTANDYQTDVGARVDDWPVRYDAAELPALGVLDLPDTVGKESIESKGAKHRMRMQVRIFSSSATQSSVLRQMIGDVVAAIGVDLTWGGLAMDTEPASEGFIIPNEAMEVAGAAIEFVVVFNTATFDPYQ